MFTQPRRLATMAAVLCAGAVVASAGAASSALAASVDPAAAALVPAQIKSAGTVTVAADATYAPDESIASDGHTVVGMDPDLAVALFNKLGLKTKVVNATFDTIIPGLSSGKYDIGMSSFTDTKARQKVVNFVTYFTAGESFFEPASGGKPVTGLASICGLKVAVETGTTEQSDATAQSKKCTAAGKPAVSVLPFASQNDANLAVASGRADVGFSDSPVAEYQVKQSKGRFKLAGSSIENAPYGIAVPKQDGTLDKAVLMALNDLIKDGSYKQILTKWGLQSGAISTPKINGAIS